MTRVQLSDSFFFFFFGSTVFRLLETGCYNTRAHINLTSEFLSDEVSLSETYLHLHPTIPTHTYKIVSGSEGVGN